MSSILYLNYYNYIDPNKKYSIAGFDLDYTIIKTKSGNVFPKNKNDWQFLNGEIKNKLIELSKNSNFLIVIFSNQKGLEKHGMTVNDFQDKINNIKKQLDINFILMAALKDDIYRKPRIEMWNYLKNILKINIDKTKSFYVGDMAGRSNDKFDTDIKFALNLKIKFMTPEQYFLDVTKKESFNLTGYQLDNNSSNTKLNIKSEPNKMVIISGYPGSGKSHLAKKFTKESKFKLFSRDTLHNKFMKNLIDSMNLGEPVLIEGLYFNNQSRNELKLLAEKYKYNTVYILVKTNYELSYHLNLYRSLYPNTNDPISPVPEIVYMKYRKNFEFPLETDWNEIIEYHPHISSKVNKYFLY